MEESKNAWAKMSGEGVEGGEGGGEEGEREPEREQELEGEEAMEIIAEGEEVKKAEETCADTRPVPSASSSSASSFSSRLVTSVFHNEVSPEVGSKSSLPL